MANLMEFLETRRPPGMSKEVFAQELGVSSAAMYYYTKKQRKLGLDSLRGMARYFKPREDTEALSKLASYAIDVDGVFTPSSN